MDVSALLPEEASSEERSQAMAAALRGQRQFAAIAQLTGDPVLGKLGTSQMEDAHQQQQLGQQSEDRRLTRALAAQQHAQQQQYQQGELSARNQQLGQQADYQKQEVGLRQQALEQGHYTHMQGADGTLYKQDTRTGEVTPVTGPTAKLATPGKAGGGDLDKALKELGTDIDPSGPKAGEFGKNMARVNAGKRVLQLVEGPEGYNINPSKMTELASSVASLINSGGAATEGTIMHLLPKTAGGDLAHTMEWLTGNPQGAEQQEFVHQLVDTAKREVGVAQGGIREVQRARLTRHQGAFKQWPKELTATARRYLPEASEEELQGYFSGAGPAAGAGAAPTHYLYSPDRKQRRPADAAGKPIGPVEANPNG